MSVYFIATNHEIYRRHAFPAGSIVIDPWRAIPDRQGVTVHRIGEHKPVLISALVPSRGRPDSLQRMIDTAYATATYERRLEFEVYLDMDDPQEPEYHLRFNPMFQSHYTNVRLHSLKRRLLSECWNVCADFARGEILMHCGDDITFDTPGWDQMVRDAFAASADKILFVHGDDLGPHGQRFGTHGFLHRRWVETVGYFVPPLFSSDWNDVWINEVANEIGRRRLLPFVTEHHHYTFGKAERDQTHAEREQRGARDGVVDLYKRTASSRKQDARKLRKAMA